jgi:predicted CXXCH cytochrome family protein
MKSSPRQVVRRPRLRGAATRWTLGAALVGSVAAAVWCGCTVTKENYATLSLFFDGVPDPNARVAGGEPGDLLIAAKPVVHQPFAEEKCEECHKTQYRPSRNDPTACLNCHDKLMDKHAWTHGAVAGGACLWCHTPHESARKWLLRGPDRKLCMQCHSAAMLSDQTVPAHADPKSSCLACHFGHGGDSAIMLRPGATAQSPPPESAAPDESKSQPVFDPKDGGRSSTPPATPARPGETGAPDGPPRPDDDEVVPPEIPNPT